MIINKPKVLTIVGPTASGKTELSYKLAEEIENKTGKTVEIISADSRQIYKHIPIATAQPPKEYLKKYKHHFINELEPEQEFNAGLFGKKARKIIGKTFEKGNIPVVVGGSGLYISSLVYGLFELDDIAESDEGKLKQRKIREDLYRKLETEGIDKLFAELKKVDEVTAEQMPHVTDRRVIRALEVYHLTGIPLSVLKSRKVEIKFDFVQYGINFDRTVLYDRINKRVDEMIELGLVDEVIALKEKGYHYTKQNSLNTVGVKEVFDHLENKISYTQMLELIKQNTRRYAKRQITWFNKDKNVQWQTTENLRFRYYKI